MPILQSTAYILSPDRDSVLMIHRNRDPEDVHYGRYLSVGGHIEPDENIVDGVLREISEESGLTVTSMRMRGSILWTGFGREPRDYLCFMFLVDGYSGVAHAENEEGTLEWVRRSDLTTLPMWPSDHEWIPLIFDDDPRQFHGIMPFHNGEMVSFSYHRI